MRQAEHVVWKQEAHTYMWFCNLIYNYSSAKNISTKSRAHYSKKGSTCTQKKDNVYVPMHGSTSNCKCKLITTFCSCDTHNHVISLTPEAQFCGAVYYVIYSINRMGVGDIKDIAELHIHKGYRY